MRFLIIEKIQGQQHIRASRASLKSAETLCKREFPGCEVIALKTKKVKSDA